MKNMDEKISLRPFLDTDKDIFERWLNSNHVAKWYGNAQDWLNEIDNRDGEYAFIYHFIVEMDGTPIGFGQFYDYRLGGEDWHGNSDTVGTYSIDYLIGNAELLGKGLGKKIILALINKIRQKSDAKSVIVQPSSENKASCGALLSCGFKFDDNNKLYRLEL